MTTGLVKELSCNHFGLVLAVLVLRSCLNKQMGN